MIATHAQIVAALMSIRPNAQWTLEGDFFDSSQPVVLQWHDEIQVRPSDEEIFAAVTTE